MSNYDVKDLIISEDAFPMNCSCPCKQCISLFVNGFLPKASHFRCTVLKLENLVRRFPVVALDSRRHFRPVLPKQFQAK